MTVIGLPVEKYFSSAEIINIKVPRLVLARIDDDAKAHCMNQSSFLVEAARSAMHA